MSFKGTLLGGVATVALFSAAGGIAPASAGQAHNWTGPYVGVQIGYGVANFDGVAEKGSSSQAIADDLNMDGVLGGAHAGFNYQFDGASPSFVVGIEGDVSFGGWNDTADARDGSDDEELNGSFDLLASVRLRAGVAIDQFLIYGTGGIAFADADVESRRDGNSKTAHFNDIGGVVGGGVEWAFSDMISVRAEGLYYIFDNKKRTSGFPEGNSGDFLKLEDTIVGRIGVSFHF